jgi:hypothetical protein
VAFFVRKISGFFNQFKMKGSNSYINRKNYIFDCQIIGMITPALKRD